MLHTQYLFSESLADLVLSLCVTLFCNIFARIKTKLNFRYLSYSAYYVLLITKSLCGQMIYRIRKRARY